MSLKPPVSCLALTETHPARLRSIRYPLLNHFAFISHLTKMATRRIIATEKTILDKDDPVEEKSDIDPAVPK